MVLEVFDADVQMTIAGLPIDMLLLVGLALALFAFGIAGGQRFSTATLLGLYVAQAVVAVLPSLRGFLLRFSVVLPDATNAVAFVVSALLATWLLAGSAVAELFRVRRRKFETVWHVLIMSVLGSALFAALFFPLLPKGAYTPSALANGLLFSDPMPFIWVLAPVFFFVILRAER